MKRPLLVYALPNDDRVKDATISLWGNKDRIAAYLEEVLQEKR